MSEHPTGDPWCRDVVCDRVTHLLEAGELRRAAAWLDRMARHDATVFLRPGGALLARRFRETVRERYPVQQIPVGSQVEVLLVVGEDVDPAELDVRLQACSMRGDRVQVVTYRGASGFVASDAVPWLPLSGSRGSRAGEVATAAAAHSFQRAEVLTDTAAFRGWLVAAASGAPVEPPTTPEHGVVEPETLPRSVKLSVVVVRSGRREAVPRLLHSLRQQTVDIDAIEVLLVDDGHTPSIRHGIPADLMEGVQVVFGSGGGRATGLRRALELCRGNHVLFLTSDATVGDETLADHLRAHESSSGPVAVLGRVRPADHTRSFIVELARRADLLYPFRPGPEECADARLVWTQNLSVPVSVLRSLECFHEDTGSSLEDLELGVLLQREQIPIEVDDRIECYQEKGLDVVAFVRRCRWIGHDWLRLARRHGTDRAFLFDPGLELDQALGLELLGAILQDEERIQGWLRMLKRIESEVDPMISRHPDCRDDVFDQLEEDSLTILRAVFRHEVCRGILGAMQEVTPLELERVREEGRSLAVVLPCRQSTEVETVRRVLEAIPDQAELVVVGDEELGSLRLPRDPRLLRLVEDRGTDPVTAVLGTTEARSVAFLDGTVVPHAGEWRILQHFLGLAPHIGAVGLAPPTSGDYAVGSVCTDIPTEVVLVRRRFLHHDPAEGSRNFLERLAGQGYHLVEVSAPRPRRSRPEISIRFEE